MGPGGEERSEFNRSGSVEGDGMDLSGAYTARSWEAAHRGEGSSLLRRLFQHERTRVAAILLVLILVSSLMAPLLSPYDCNTINLDRILVSPSVEHVLGTDEMGRDLFTRLLYGGRYSILIAFGSVLVSLLIGISVGCVSGYFGGLADRALTAAVDLFLSLPVFLVLLILGSLSGGRVWLLPVIIGSFSWMEIARIVRAEFVAIERREFVSAARSVGVGDFSLIFRHILPIALGPVVVSATAGLAQAMLAESALSFLGLGVQPPVPTWGNMLRNAQVFIQSSPTVAFAPGFLIFITCLSFNLIGEGLSEALSRN